MANSPSVETFDAVVIGSGFGGSVSAMRLTEKGYRVLVLERGKAYRDEDFAGSNWNVWKYLWAPAARCFGILQISPFRHIIVLHGSGVGGGSLGYANVLMKPSDKLFSAPAWHNLADWKSLLAPHYDTARRMLGVATNPRFWPADNILKEVAAELGQLATFQATTVGAFFGQPGDEGREVPDPYFGGEGPARRSCTHCGACMVGCRHNAKNTLVKNYLYFAQKWGAQVRPEAEVRDIRPLPAGQPDGARFEVVYRRSTAWLQSAPRRVRARRVVLAAGALGTLRLLFRCRDVTRSLPSISARLGELVRTNSESLLGVSDRRGVVDYSKGVAITSIFNPDAVTAVEPVRYPSGSDLMRFLAGPMIETGSVSNRILKLLGEFVRRPADVLVTHIVPGWARRSTILLVMQTEDNHLQLKLGRGLLTLGRRGLVSQPDKAAEVPAHLAIGHRVTRSFAAKMDGIPASTINESLLNIPMTAHLLGGCPFGDNSEKGVIGLDTQVHNYPGLYVVDGSIVPANPGVNPSLTITALAEYAMSLVPAAAGHEGARSFGSEAS